MAIKKLDNGNVQVEVGHGDILTGIREMEDNTQRAALVILGAKEPREPGQYVFVHESFDWNVEDHPVQIVFSSEKSVDLMIEQLVRVKRAIRDQKEEN